MTSYYKPSMSIDSCDKETELTTNPYEFDRNWINKGALGKFFRKQDFGKIEKKRKFDQGKSLLCYLTPKNCEDSSKMIKQKFRQNPNDLSINNFLSKSYFNLNSKQPFIKSSVNVSLVEQPTSRLTSIEKGKKQIDRKIKVFSFKENCVNELKQGGISSREVNSKLRGTSSFRNLNKSDVKRQDQQTIQLCKNPSNKSISMIFDKELKKMKAQCEHYSQQLQVCNKEKQQSANQLKSLNALVQQLKQRNANLLTSQGNLEKEILQLNSQLNSLTNENRELKQEVKHINDEKTKYIEEISYLKSNIADLDERIDIMLQTTPLSTPRNNRNLTSSATIHNGRRINSMCFVNKGRQSSDEEELKLMIHQLQQQLKYSQVQVNMLKRVKMDVNKKNQEFIKLQRQNQILKNQIFEMKMADAIEEQELKTNRNVKSHMQNKSGFHPSVSNRNNFQINHKNNNKTKDYVVNKSKDFDNVSESSDTFSLNLSLSPSQRQREKFRN